MKLIQNLSQEEYFAIDAVSKTDLSFMAKSPLHYLKRKELMKETDAMRLGTLLHMALLEPARFRDSYIVEPVAMPDGEEINRRKKDHRAFLDGFREKNKDKLIVTEKQFDSLVGMLQQASSNPEISNVLNMKGMQEVAGTWETNGVLCKGRADFIYEHPTIGRVIVEVKKTRDASPEGFSRQAYNLLYHLQAAMYLDGFEAKHFVFIAIEDALPNASGVYWADDSLIDAGRRLRDRLLARLVECKERKFYPAYTQGVTKIMLPAWAVNSEQERIEGEI